MANPTYLFHVDEYYVIDEHGHKNDAKWLVQLRCFNYPGAFSSWVVEEIEVDAPIVKRWGKEEKVSSCTQMKPEEYIEFKKQCLDKIRKIIESKGMVMPSYSEIM